jgi:hypothetical protein
MGFWLALAAVLVVAPGVPAAQEDGVGTLGRPIDSKFELFVNDPDPSARFYELLGFEVVERKPRGYTTLRSGPVEIALSPVRTVIPLRWLGFLRNPPFGTEIVLYVEPEALEDMQRKLIHTGRRTTLIRRQPWGLRDFRTRDPEGYYVRVSEIAPFVPPEEPEIPEASAAPGAPSGEGAAPDAAAAP